MSEDRLDRLIVEFRQLATEAGVLPELRMRGTLHERARMAAYDAVRVANSATVDPQAADFLKRWPLRFGVPTERPPPPETIRVGFFTPCLAFPGGWEEWLAAMLEHKPAGITWSGVAVAQPHYVAREALYRVVPHAQVLMHPTSMATLCAVSDVVVAWGQTNIPELIPAGWPGRLVVTSHGCGEWTRSWCYAAASRADVLVGVSQEAITSFPDAAAHKIRVIHNGVSPQRVAAKRPRAELRREWGLADGERAAVYIGRLSLEKNPAAVARACQGLGREWRPVLVGDGQGAEQVKLECLAARPDTVFVPPTMDIGSVLAAADVIVQASPSEGFCLAIVEAWLARRPLVSTHVGAIVELEPETGPLAVSVPRTPQPEEIAAAIRRAVRPENDAVIDRAYRVAVERFTARRMADRWGALFRELMDDRRR